MASSPDRIAAGQAPLLLEHQDSAIPYEPVQAWYCVENGLLFVSIEARAVAAGGFPPGYHFAVNGASVELPLRKRRLSLHAPEDDGDRVVHVYTTFHAEAVSAELDILAVGDTWMDVQLDVASDDPVYYDERARPTRMHGRCQLQRAEPGAMWLPC